MKESEYMAWDFHYKQLKHRAKINSICFFITGLTLGLVISSIIAINLI